MCTLNEFKEINDKEHADIRANFNARFDRLEKKIEDPDFLTKAHHAGYTEAMKHAEPSPKTLELITEMKEDIKNSQSLISQHLENEAQFSRDIASFFADVKEVRTQIKELGPAKEFTDGVLLGRKILFGFVGAITAIGGAILLIPQAVKVLISWFR